MLSSMWPWCFSGMKSSLARLKMKRLMKGPLTLMTSSRSLPVLHMTRYIGFLTVPTHNPTSTPTPNITPGGTHPTRNGRTIHTP